MITFISRISVKFHHRSYYQANGPAQGARTINIRQTILRTGFVLLCCSLPLQSYATPVILTLPDSIRLAITSSHDIRIAELETSKADLELKKNKARYLPTISMTHTQTQVAEKPKPEYGNYITLRLPLYDGGQTRDRVTQSQTALFSSTDYLDYAKQQVAINVFLDYYDALAAQERKILTEQAVHQLTYYLDEARRRSGAGATVQTETDLAHFRQYDTLLRQQEERQAFDKLSQLLHLPPDQKLILTETPAQPVPATLHEAIDQALKHRQDLAQARRSLQVATLGTKIAAKEARPTVYLYFVMYDLGLPEQYWYSSLYVTGDLFDGGQTRLKARQSDLNAAIAAERIQQKMEVIKLETAKAFESWQQSGQLLAAAEQPVNRAEAAYAAAAEGYRTGQADMATVLGAHADLITAKTNHLNARYDYYKNQVRLLHATGTLPLF